MIDNAVSKLAAYALQTGLIEENESIWAVNTILDVLKLDSYTDPQENWGEIELAPVLEELLEDAHARGVLAENSVVYRDLFDTELMGRLTPRPAQVKTIRDTVATLRLDAVTACGFSLSRSKAAALIASGKVALNHRECLKADRPVAEGDVLTCRGLGKCVVKEVPGQSKKGRTMLVMERYQ